MGEQHLPSGKKYRRLLRTGAILKLIFSMLPQAVVACIAKGASFVRLGFVFPIAIAALSFGVPLAAEHWPSVNRVALWLCFLLPLLSMWCVLGIIVSTFSIILVEGRSRRQLVKMRNMIDAFHRRMRTSSSFSEMAQRLETIGITEVTEFLVFASKEAQNRYQAVHDKMLALAAEVEAIIGRLGAMRKPLWLYYYGEKSFLVVAIYITALMAYGGFYFVAAQQSPAGFSLVNQLGLADAYYESALAALTMGGWNLHPEAYLVKCAFLSEMVLTLSCVTVFIGVALAVFGGVTGEEVGQVEPRQIRDERDALVKASLELVRSVYGLTDEPFKVVADLFAESKAKAEKAMIKKTVHDVLPLIIVVATDGKSAEQLGPKMVNSLIGFLRDSAPLTRLSAAKCLGQIKASAAREALTALLSDPDKDVREAATAALASLGAIGASDKETSRAAVPGDTPIEP